MGDTFNEGSEYEMPVHKVRVQDFYLCKYPVTQAAWKKIMGEGNNPSYFINADKPVENVSWDDAQGFIKKLNEKTGRNYRLPTEAEWEYAARERGKKVCFGNGKDVADSKEINFKGSIRTDIPIYGGYTTQVGSLKCPNALGLHDMSGNVNEWCEDVWHDSYEGAPTDGSAWTSGREQSLRVTRGGCWYSNPVFCRAASRYWGDNDERAFNYGFRLAR